MTADNPVQSDDADQWISSMAAQDPTAFKSLLPYLKLTLGMPWPSDKKDWAWFANRYFGQNTYQNSLQPLWYKSEQDMQTKLECIVQPAINIKDSILNPLVAAMETVTAMDVPMQTLLDELKAGFPSLSGKLNSGTTAESDEELRKIKGTLSNIYTNLDSLQDKFRPVFQAIDERFNNNDWGSTVGVLRDMSQKLDPLSNHDNVNWYAKDELFGGFRFKETLYGPDPRQKGDEWIEKLTDTDEKSMYKMKMARNVHRMLVFLENWNTLLTGTFPGAFHNKTGGLAVLKDLWMQFLKVITAFKQIINIAQGDATDNEEVVQKKALGRLGEAFNFWKKLQAAVARSHNDWKKLCEDVKVFDVDPDLGFLPFKLVNFYVLSVSYGGKDITANATLLFVDNDIVVNTSASKFQWPMSILLGTRDGSKHRFFVCGPKTGVHVLHTGLITPSQDGSCIFSDDPPPYHLEGAPIKIFGIQWGKHTIRNVDVWRNLYDANARNSKGTITWNDETFKDNGDMSSNKCGAIHYQPVGDHRSEYHSTVSGAKPGDSSVPFI